MEGARRVKNERRGGAGEGVGAGSGDGERVEDKQGRKMVEKRIVRKKKLV